MHESISPLKSLYSSDPNGWTQANISEFFCGPNRFHEVSGLSLRTEMEINNLVNIEHPFKGLMIFFSNLMTWGNLQRHPEILKTRDPKQYFLSSVYRLTKKVFLCTFISDGVWLHILIFSTKLY